MGTEDGLEYTGLEDVGCEGGCAVLRLAKYFAVSFDNSELYLPNDLINEYPEGIERLGEVGLLVEEVEEVEEAGTDDNFDVAVAVLY